MGSKQKKKSRAAESRSDLFEKPMENPFRGAQREKNSPAKKEEAPDLDKLMENPFAVMHEGEEARAEEIVPMRLLARGLKMPEKEPEVERVRIPKEGHKLKMPPKPPRGVPGKGKVVRQEDRA